MRWKSPSTRSSTGSLPNSCAYDVRKQASPRSRSPSGSVAITHSSTITRPASADSTFRGSSKSPTLCGPHWWTSRLCCSRHRLVRCLQSRPSPVTMLLLHHQLITGPRGWCSAPSCGTEESAPASPSPGWLNVYTSPSRSSVSTKRWTVASISSSWSRWPRRSTRTCWTSSKSSRAPSAGRCDSFHSLPRREPTRRSSTAMAAQSERIPCRLGSVEALSSAGMAGDAPQNASRRLSSLEPWRAHQRARRFIAQDVGIHLLHFVQRRAQLI